MKKIFLTAFCLLLIAHFSFSQVAINKDGSATTDTTAMLEIKKGIKSKLKVRSLGFNDTSVLELSNRNTINQGTDFLITARGEYGLLFTTKSDLSNQINDSLLILRRTGNIGIGNTNPLNKLDVTGNINVTGTIKANGVTGQPGQVLGVTESGNMSWVEKTNGNSLGGAGYGAWGDCSVNNISEYNPVGDSTGLTGDLFGMRVSVSGNFAIIASPYDDVGTNTDQGSASIFQFREGNWVFMQKLTDATGAANDLFGLSVYISGNYAIVGAPNDNVGANTDQGSASIFRYNGSSWVLMQKITDATGAAGDAFGTSVSVSGNFVFIGAPLDDASGIDRG